MRTFRRWIDSHLVSIGVWFLVGGMLLMALRALSRSVHLLPLVLDARGASMSFFGMAVVLLSELASPLTYSSVMFIGVGVLLRNWRVTLVGFENSRSGDIKVEGPDAQNIVWIGKSYSNAHDAQLAADALATRLTRSPINATPEAV